ncbi:MAG: TIGR03936 family radical SAM-associated protein, partial [Sphaerochaetaceae bacterium]|nr:TIGR03936 family radical SAM-associated protein [Sphaerochaetaceae bacterium]
DIDSVDIPHSENKRQEVERSRQLAVMLRYGKTGKAVYASHISVMRIFEQAFQRSGIPIAFTQGFNPKPKLEFVNPLSMGISGDRELLLAQVLCTPAMCTAFPVELLNKALPEGFEVFQYQFFDETERRITLSRYLGSSRYEISNIKNPELVKQLENLIPGDFESLGYEISHLGAEVFVVRVKGESNLVKLLFGKDSDRFAILSDLSIKRTGLFIHDENGMSLDYFSLKL